MHHVPQVSDMMDHGNKISRRGALLGIGAAAAGGLLSGCNKEDPYALTKPPVPGAQNWAKGEERWISSACGQCPAGCGMRVRVVEGRAVKIEGDPASPINRGGIGPRGASGPQVVYDPDRIREPLRRKGRRGEPSFEPISWEEALELLSARLQGLREKGEAHRAAIVCGRPRGLMAEFWRRFAGVYGTPNFFSTTPINDHMVADALWAMQGVREIPAYDWGNARYILSLGSGVLESSCQRMYFARAQARLRRGDGGVRSTIVHVGSPSSKTAMNSDEWISIAPGTHGAFALGIAHILVRDGAYDREFVERHGFGFASWKDKKGRSHKGFKEILDQYGPEMAGQICRVDPAEIEQVARDLADQRPSFVITGEEGTGHASGLYTAMAVHALNGLLGAIDRTGGLLTQRLAPLADWPATAADEMARKGLAQPRLDGAGQSRFPWSESVLNALPEALERGEPYGLDTLLLYYSNPLYSRPDPLRWRKSLERIPFVVTFTPFLDETASQIADLVLPDHTYLERWEDAAPAPSVGYAVFGIRQPVVEHLYNTRPAGDVLIDLAAKLGGSVGEAFAFKNFRDAMNQRVAGIQAAQRGSIVKETPQALNKKLQAAGFWSDSEYKFESWNEILRTPSGKFEFFSQNVLAALEAVAAWKGEPVEAALASCCRKESLDEACLPHHADLAWTGDEHRFPLFLLPYTPSIYAEGSGANLPWLREAVSFTGRPAWKTEAEIHPELAQHLGVRSGEALVVESPSGSAEVVAYVTADLRPDQVRIARGGGHSAFGRWAQGWGANVMGLLGGEPDPLTGASAFLGMRVSVRRKDA